MRAIITDSIATRLDDLHILSAIFDATKTARETMDIKTMKAFLRNGVRRQSVRKCRAYVDGEELVGYYCKGYILDAKKRFGSDDECWHESEFDNIHFV